jgi:hypothetical protein
LRWRPVAGEVLLVVTGILFYFGVRGITHTAVSSAQQNAAEVARLQERLGFAVEDELQDAVDGSVPVMTVLNWIYIWGHWPVIVAVLAWLFLRHPDGYRLIRNSMMLSGGIGLLVFAAYPVAPPRLASLGLVDTVTEYSTSYRVLQPPALVNQYAAMPSLHVGWDLLMGIALMVYGGHRLLRVIGAVLPVAMTASVVLTANHFVLDAVAGAALVLASLAVVVRLTRPPRVALPVPRSARMDESTVVDLRHRAAASTDP